jgi:hypothetical protein
MVLVLSPCMENMFIAQELDISNLKDHVESQSMARLLQHFCSFNLLSTQLWNNASIHEATKGLHVVWIPLAVNTAIWTLFEVENGGFDVGFFADGNFAFAIEVPDGTCEGFSYVGAGSLQFIPDVVGGDNVGLATFQGSSYA